MLSQYIHDYWGGEQGFNGGPVTSFAQTPDGYLWIATEKGLIRFDGLTFRPFQQASPSTFPIGAVQGLVTDAQGNLWILLQSTKVLRYHDGKFELGREEAENGITSIAKRRDGTALFSSLTLGVLTYHGGRFEILTSPADRAPSEESATKEADNRSTVLSWATQLAPHRFAEPNSVVTSMAENTDGKVWLGTRNKGLFYMSEGKVLAAMKGQSNSKINCLLTLDNRELWVGTDTGIVRWNDAEVTSVGVPSSLRHIPVLSMIRDHDSNIWVGTDRALIRVNRDGVPADEGNPQKIGAVTALFEDREGSLWVGGTKGVARLRDSTFVTYSVAGLKSQGTGALYVDPEDKTWFAPSQGGLRWRKGGSAGVVAAAGLSQDIVYSISSNEKNELWVGRQRGGLTHLSNVNGSITTRTYTQADGLPQNSVYAVHQNRDGSVWSATLSGGVSKYKAGQFTTYTTADGLASNTVNSIAEGADGTMWFGTPNGLSALTKGGWRTYTVHDGLSSQDVNCLLPDSKGNLWIGTGGGLAFLNANHIHVPSRVPDSVREAVFGMAEDRDGMMWVATTNHILRLKRDSLVEDALTETDVREYGLDDGLSGTEGVRRYQSVVADSQGRVWFSTTQGLSMVNPARAAATSAPALVHIESAAGDGTAFDLAGPIQFPPGTRRTTFHFVGLSLNDSQRVRYRYRLDHFDHGWSEPTTNREATYGNLAAGTYRFRVISSNSAGIWNTEGTSIDFTVLPEFYQTTWFRLLCVAGVLALIWTIYQLRFHQLQQQFNMKLEERVDERTRIARELHDTLLQSFQGQLMRFQAVSNELAEGKPKQELDETIDRAAEAIREARDAVQGLRSSVLESHDLEAAIGILGRDLAASESQPPEFTIQVEGAQRSLHPLLRDEVYRVAGEALRNAFRHADARRIEVEIRYDESQFRLRVRDDGRGIDPKLLVSNGRAGHFGLPGIRERAKRVGGKLTVWSQLDSGTEVEMRIPAKHAYTRFSDLRRGWWFTDKISSKDHEIKS
jgi:ligand-binding sensor domain-containing protein/signal transduction histidine kinase